MARKRRGRGEGAIFRRGDGTWVATLSLGYDGNGKRKRRTVYGANKAEVQEKLRELHNASAAGTVLDVGQVTLAQYLARWLENTARTKVSPTTYHRYEEHVRLHINPTIGGNKLAKLTALHVEQLYAELERMGQAAGGGKEKRVSAAMRQKVGKTLRQALRHAVNRGLIPNNAAEKVALSRSPKKEMRVYDLGQVARFLEASEKDRLHALYVLALDSGMRQGELFALEAGDIDFQGGSVFVQRSLENVGDRLRVKETKSAKGRRRIDLSRYTMDALHEHRKRMLAEGHAGGPIFCDTKGGYLRRSNFLRDSFELVIARSKLPPIRFHDLRHTSATLLLLADVNVKVVSERLGHAKIQITLDTYSHVLPTMQKAAADKLDRIFGGMAKRAL
jgi:integrase